MRAARVDLNQRYIVATLRGAGATVEHLHAVGKGCPDLLVGYMGENYLLEVKGENGSLTPHQVTWHAAWGGRVHVVRTGAEAMRAIGICVPDV